MKFKDRLVRCAACGAEFVYTVPEQRQRAAQGQAIEAPAFCRACRGADVRLAQAAGLDQTPTDVPDTPRVAPRPAPRGRSPGVSTGQRSERPRGDRSGGAPARATGRAGKRPGGARRGGTRPRPRQTELRVRHIGTVKWFDEARGFGFIAEENGDELFVHSSGILTRARAVLEQGQSVEYEVEHTERGLQAVDVVPLP
jgi:cold shock CspA family protein